MAPSSSDKFRPFKNLKVQLKSAHKMGHTPAAESSPPNPAPPPPLATTEAKEVSFSDVVQDVSPLKHNKVTRPLEPLSRHLLPSPTSEKKVQRYLRNSFQKSPLGPTGSCSDELNYTGYRIHFYPPERLHEGYFSIQALIDLHSLDRDQAKAAFDDFIEKSILYDKRMLLIIHGRGLSSPGEPVLKQLVLRWLSAGPWKRWILAFSNAQVEDGGSGATYVLLRKNPVTKIPPRGKRRRRQGKS